MCACVYVVIYTEPNTKTILLSKLTLILYMVLSYKKKRKKNEWLCDRYTYTIAIIPGTYAIIIVFTH